MDFPKRSKVKLMKSPDEESLDRLLPHNCLFYILPPLIDVSLQDFEDLAIERLKLLRILEQAGVKHPKVLSKEWKEHVTDELNLAGLKHFLRLTKGNENTDQAMNARRRDYLSHFILRFAYCRSEDLRRWFIAREMEFFRFKFSALTTQEVKEFVNIYEMGYRPISDDQKHKIRQDLQSFLQQSIETIDFYKVSFLAVLDLVQQRKCYLKAGFAYVSSMDFISIIGSHHQKFIEKGLMAHLKLLPEFEDDERIVGIIKGLHNSYIGKDYTINKDAEIPIESLDQLSLKSYPPCMKMCHDSLRSTHHLKYQGRLQYGLFLKGIGVTLEDSLRFWREEFTKTMDPDKFDKAYAYGIRYNYGKEGQRTNWSPHSCMKIINTSVSSQDVCGCPFKIWDPVEMRTKLINYGLNAVNVQDVISYATKGHFQIACGRYFELIHNTKLEEGINHPNGFFENSQIVMGVREAKQKTQQSPQVSQQNQRLQQAMSQKQAFKRKHEAKQRVDHDYDDELWKLSEHDKEIIEKMKAKEIKDEKALLEVSQIESMQWEDEDDDVSQLNKFL